MNKKALGKFVGIAAVLMILSLPLMGDSCSNGTEEDQASQDFDRQNQESNNRIATAHNEADANEAKHSDN